MHRYVVVNSFASELFQGNPVAIFFDCDDLATDDMQKLAKELHLSETTFICSPKRGGDVNVRIFTPVNELDFAGHPLLGTALALSKETGLHDIKIETQKGVFRFSITPVITSRFTGYVNMEQPTPIVSLYEHKHALLEALGVSEGKLPVAMYDLGPRHVFVDVNNIKTLSDIRPDFKKLSQFEDMAALVFCPDDLGGWRLRMFSPAYGVQEDAATGSAAGPLALHLANHGLIKFSEKIKITQGVELGRPSVMYAVASLEKEISHLEVGGYAFQIADGQYYI